jgi:putative DNA primase/helicase
MPDTISILRHSTASLAKTWRSDGTVKPYDDAKFFTLETAQVGDIEALSALLARLEVSPHACLIRGAYVGDTLASQRDGDQFKPGRVRRALDYFNDQPLHALLVEVDNFEPLAFDPLASPEGAVDEYIGAALPAAFSGVSYHWQLSNSAGRAEHAGKLKAHVWFWLETAYTSEQVKTWAVNEGVALDRAVLNAVQVHYTAAPVFEAGVADPVPRRSGFVQGLVADAVPLVLDADAVRAVGRMGGRQARLRELREDDPIAQALVDRGLVLSEGRAGELNITCPFAEQHTGASGETSTRYWPPNTGGYAKGNFKCLHAHCVGRGRGTWLARLGIFEDLDAEAFGPVDGAGTAGVGGSGAGGAGGVNADPAAAVVDIKGIPEAKHLCTDQANANRLVESFGKRLFVAAGRWYSWDSRRWVPDEGDVYRYACQLSRIVHAEAAAWRAKATADLSTANKNKALADALDKWAVKCEMKGSIEAAVGLARKMLTIDGAALDRNPWLLNCLNGTVDLRTGELRPHRASDYITKLVSLNFDLEAAAPLWGEVLAQITLEVGRGTQPVAQFLQRWFGYCATGLTREQQFVVHYGNGSNGKSTVLDMVADVLGDYAGTAAPGLLVNGGRDRHPTEIADLFGRRMITAHESGDGGVLREDFVKQATGGDRIKARFMHADFFEFVPTHKLQLLTNHKPLIKGQDVGIWRRVVLVPYLARFGGREEVNAGRAHFVKDVGLLERLGAERAGVLAWVVRGAIAWAQDGLQPPDSVLAASKDYQTEQDRIGQFVAECCEVGGEFAEPLAVGMGEGLYPAYVGWCKEGGTMALAKNRFQAEVLRAVAGSRVEFGKVTGENGRRRSAAKIRGLRLLPLE